MKAIVHDHYGPPDVLRCEEVETPAAGDDDVLVQVRAASLNPLDWHVLRGQPFPVRLQCGLRRPKVPRLGVDVAGEVAAVGRNVARLKPGDAVFGTCRGALAEFVCTAESALALKPQNLTFEQAAAVPIAAFTALQGLRDKGQVQPGQKVLINGASGGVGTFAVQIARWLGAEVAGVCSTRNVDLVRSLGAEQVLDYTREDFTQGGTRYDVIFDCIGNRSLSACRRALEPKGTYILIGGPLTQVFKTLAVSRFVRQNLTLFLTRRNPEDLAVLRDLLETGKVTPVLDRIYRLSEAAAAFRYLEEGHARGKVVVTM